MVLHKYIEAAVIAGLLFFNAALAYFQEGRAQATLKALKSSLALNASVQRDGRWNARALALSLGEAARANEEQRRRRRRSEQIAQERERVTVGPLHVVDREDEAAPDGDVGDELPERAEDPGAELAAISFRDRERSGPHPGRDRL